MINSLKQLTSLNGVSGSERPVTEYIKSQIMPYADKVYTDVMGNLVAIKRGQGKRIMFMAHTDEIGIVATYVDDDGFVRVSRVGGVTPVKFLNNYVTFENGTRGVFCAPSAEGELKIEDCYIDIGATDRQDALSKIDLGMTARFDGDTFEMGNLVVSKALDNRLGCYALIETLKNIKSTNNELYFVFTTQEEVGLRGAKVCGFDINPDIAIAVDIVTSADTPNCNRYGTALGKGAAIKTRDGSAICSKPIVDMLINTAEQNEIAYQIDAKTAGGTDIGGIQATGRGAYIGAVTIPIRRTHTIGETAAKSDITAAIDLLTAFAQKEVENL